jgi:hypothetical protein
MMKLETSFIIVLSLLLAVTPTAQADACSTAPDANESGNGEKTEREDLERRIRKLEAEVKQLRSKDQKDGDLIELERRIDLLAAEVEKLRTGGATEVDTPGSQRGLGPAASKVYNVERGVSIGGYGEMLYQNFASETEDGSASEKSDQLDFLRAIVYVGYKFNDRIHFNSEIEFEHASTGKGGEVSVEFAYLDFSLRPEFGIRGGMLLVPMGFINQLHEPPIFYGARRPEVESAIIPTTWRENGAGIFGEVGPVEYRAYAVAGLDASGFSASGIRGGRQKGARSLAEDFAFTGRVDLTSVPGLLAGISFYTGGSGQGTDVDGHSVSAKTSLFDLHTQYRYRGLHVRGLYAKGSIGDAALVNKVNGLSGSRSVGADQFGWYLEGAYDLMSLFPRGEWALAPYLRYEQLDTQETVPAGFRNNSATNRSILTFGLDVKPISRIVVKADYQRMRTEARSGLSQFNVALGFLF